MADYKKKPDWFKIKLPTSTRFSKTQDIVKSSGVATVCEEASCPNISECWTQGTATFMIMGDTCTRACRFCNVKTGIPKMPPDSKEPENLAEAIKGFGVEYVVITSVNRDELPDGGSGHFAKCIKAIQEKCPSTLVEVLTPDFFANEKQIRNVVEAKPDVYAHNIEVVKELQREIRDPRASYANSLETLRTVKRIDKKMPTKSSIMVGVGETQEQVLQAMGDLRDAGVSFLTVGQYLRPTENHYPVNEFIHPDVFKFYEEEGTNLGFDYVASGPLVRSSYKAGEYYIKNMLDGRNGKEEGFV
ncbi:TPA: lipoyl synthase [archaeon]|nr:lipoyl synthase [Candidatus Undinarchaeales archaeon SRR5007147.bin71]